MTENKEQVIRFQDCPWYIQMWRFRWYLLIPLWALKFWLTPWLEDDTGELSEDEPWNTWRISWSIAVGTAQGKMHWWYTWEEVKVRLDFRPRK